MIYTGYFAQVNKYDGILASIAIKTPKGFKGVKLRCFMPKFWLLDKFKKGEIDSKEYSRLFELEILAHLEKQNVKNLLKSLSKNKDLFLLCYEKPENFCHRHIVANWIRNELGLEVKEYKVSQTIKESRCD